MKRIQHEIHFSWQAQYLVRLEGVACRSAQCKYLVVALGLWYLYLLANNLQQGCKYVYVCFKYVKYIKLFKPMWATYM